LAITVQRPFGYELSIYNGLNAYAIMPLAIVLVLSYSWVVRGRLWAFTFMTTILCVTNVFLISLPYIKGYYLYGQADPCLFVGFVVDILKSGHTYFDDFYPLSHILVAQLSQILGTEPRFVFALLGPVMWAVFALGASLATKQIEHQWGPLVGGTARGLACVFWLPASGAAGEASGFVYVLPFFMTLELSGMVMYLLLRPRTASLTAVLVILVVSMPLYHPLTAAIFTISLFLGSFLIRPLSSFFRRMSGVIAVALAGWLVYFTMFRNMARGLALFLSGEAAARQVFQTVAKLSLGATGTIELFAKLYGHGFFALSLAALSYPIAAKYVKGNIRLRKQLMIPYSFLLVSLGLMLALFFGGSVGFSPFRFYVIAVMISLPAAIWTFLYFVRRSPAVVGRVLSATIIILLWVSSVVSLYPSPYLLLPNDQVTHQMVLPVQWLDEHHPSYVVLVAPFNIFSGRYMYRFVAGFSESDTRYGVLPDLPDHLAYGDVSQIRSVYHTLRGIPAQYPIYVIFDASVVQIYKELYPGIGRYTWDDMQTFLSNPSVLKTYDNGESQVDEIVGN
jgi:hypothetical protein